MKALKRKSASVTFSCLLLVLGSCGGGSGEGLDENGQPASVGEQGPDTSDTTNAGVDGDLFTRIQNELLTPDCATSGCHSGTTSPLGLNLAAGKAYNSLISKDSNQINGLMLVEPSNADASYLVHKLEGTQGGGAQMPMGKPALKGVEIALVREWIQAGAPDASTNSVDSSIDNHTNGDTSNTDDGEPANPDGSVDTTTPDATLAGIQSDVFDIHCSGCHGGASPSSDLNLVDGNSYLQLVGRYAAMGDEGQQLVVPGDAANSFLVDKLRGKNLGTADERGRSMPLYGEPLNEETLQQIETWINTGAEDN